METSTSLLHVLLLLGGSKYGSRVSLLQGEGALNLFSEWNGDGPLLVVINLVQPCSRSFNPSKVEFEGIYRL